MMFRKLEETWAETLAVVLLLIGFMVSLLLTKAWAVYLIVLLSGGLAGRILYIKRFREPIFPFILMSLGFLMGYVLGSFWASRFWVVLLFLTGWGVSYYLHWKGILILFEKEGFLK